MGILSDFVIADAGSADAIGESRNPGKQWPTLQAKGVETIKLATLYCSITGEAYHNDVQKSFPLVAGNKEEGPWVFEFSREILETIANIDEAQIPDIAQKWASTEELQMDGWAVRDAIGFVKELASHASKALRSDNSLFLWLSL